MPPTLPNTLTNGTVADASQVMADLNAINAAVDQVAVSSFPGSPYDGQEIYYLADATNGVIWHLKYRAASPSAYKWEHVGGSEMTSTGTGGSSSSLSFVAPTGPCSIALPRTGDYRIIFGGEIQNGGGGYGYLAPAATGLTAGTEPLNAYFNSLLEEKHYVMGRANAISGSVALQHKTNNGSTTVITGNLFLSIVPVRVA